MAPPDDLYERPDNAFVAQFIGENNTLMGTVRAINGTTCTIDVDGGGEVLATKINVAGEGQRSTLSLRPERVFVSPEEGKCPNNVEARVEELIYLGDHVRTRVNLLGHNDFIIKIPNAAGHEHLREGQQVNVGWHADDCRALDYA